MGEMPAKMPRGRPRAHCRTNLAAAKATIRVLEAEGKLEAVDALLVTNVLTLAEAVDANPGRAILRKEYREAANQLQRARDDDGDGVAELLERLRTPVVHPATNGAAHPGR